MMMPVRCFSCGQVVADKWDSYNERVNKNNEDPGKVLDEMKVTRYCCRRMFISHIDLIDDILSYGRK